MKKILPIMCAPGAGVVWDDLKRDTAVRSGFWVSMGETPESKTKTDGKKYLDGGGGGFEIKEYFKKYSPKKIGFHVPSWLSPFVSISEVAGAFLKGLTNKNALKDFNNFTQGAPMDRLHPGQAC